MTATGRWQFGQFRTGLAHVPPCVRAALAGHAWNRAETIQSTAEMQSPPGTWKYRVTRLT